MKQKIFAVENLNSFSLLMAVFLNFFSFKTWYIKTSYVLSKTISQSSLKKININKIIVNTKDEFIINHETDFFKKCQHYFEKKFLNKKLIGTFKDLFKIDKNFEKKISIVMHDYFQNYHSHHSAFAVFLIFLNQNKKKNNYIIKISNSEIKKKLVRLYFPKEIILKSYLENLYNNLNKIFFLVIKLPYKLAQKLNKKRNLYKENYNQKVIFFPHKSIFYGDVFVKNYFYNHSLTSPFHIRNVAHVEYDHSIANNQKILNLYKKLKIKNVFFKEKNIIFFTRQMYIFFNYILKKGDKILKTFDLHNVLLIFRIFYKFKSFEKELHRFPKAKLAIIGYDILFPKVLSLALESKKIKTLAVMDRSINADSNAANIITDNYLVPSRFFENLTRKKKYSLINKYYHTGIIRKNFFSNSSFIDENKKFRKKYKKIVLVLDYKTTLNKNLCIITDLKNNLLFYNDIIEISKKFPKYLFVIRSKDLSFKLKPLEKIRKKLLDRDNIILDKKRNFNRSFHLGKHSDLSIMRACSFVDDMLSIKKNVVIYDKFLSATNYNLLRYRYLKLPIFSSKSSDLEKKIKFFIKNRNYLFNGQNKARVNRLFNYKVDPNKKLNEIMESTLN